MELWYCDSPCRDESRLLPRKDSEEYLNYVPWMLSKIPTDRRDRFGTHIYNQVGKILIATRTMVNEYHPHRIQPLTNHTMYSYGHSDLISTPNSSQLLQYSPDEPLALMNMSENQSYIPNYVSGTDDLSPLQNVHPSTYQFAGDTPPRDHSEPRRIVESKSTSSLRQGLAHPYARLYSKRDSSKRHRKVWNHALEKSLFSPDEL